MEARLGGSRLVLAHRRADVAELNEAIRAVRQARGDLGRGEVGGEFIYRTSEGERAFAPGDRLLFRENNRELGVKNGMLGTVERAEDGRIGVRLDSLSGPGRGRAVSVSMVDYAAVDHGYATTIHKAQGATVDRTYVLASGTMDRHLTYVAMTRHREAVTLYADREEFSNVAALSARLSRSRAKETTLDYDRTAYAGRRGVEARPREVVAAREIEAGRAGFRARFEAHRQQQAVEVARYKEAHGLVREWTRLSETYNKALPGLEADPAVVGEARAALQGFARTLDRHAEAAQRLRTWGRDFGIREGSALAQVLAAPDAGRAIGRLIDGAEEQMRGHLALEAERAAARKQQERSLSRDRGMSM
nr:hypothetical protein AA700_0219 [Acidiphilium acidophilum DSM 700]